METYTIAIIGLIAFIGIFAKAYMDDKTSENEENNLNKEIEEFLNKKKKFTYTEEYVNNDMTQGILLNEESDKIIVFKDSLEKTSEFNFKDVLKAEIIKDGEVIRKVNRSSQVKGAVLGSLIAGDAGTIIGGLSGDSKSHEKIKQIDLKIYLDNTSMPSVSINFFSAPINPKTNKKESVSMEEHPVLIQSIKDIDHWLSIINILIERSKNQEKVSNNHSIEVLEKLVDMHKEGLLTREEFEAEKQKILKS